jgi:hypothetical protein
LIKFTTSFSLGFKKTGYCKENNLHRYVFTFVGSNFYTQLRPLFGIEAMLMNVGVPTCVTKAVANIKFHWDLGT